MLRTILFSLLFLLTAVLSLSAQDFPYSLNLEQEARILGFGGSMLAGGYYLEIQLEDLSPTALEKGNVRDIFFLDRGAVRQRSEAYRSLSDKLLRNSVLLPATLLAARPVRKKPLVLGLMMAEAMILNEGATKMLKVLVRRRRPLTYNTSFSPEERSDHDGRQSFPSGHTSNAAALAFFTAKVFHDLHPDSKLRPFVWGAAAAVPALTGYARYRAGKHFPTDILAGYALGAAVGILVPQWHKTPEARGLVVSPTAEGIGLVYRW
ncbi:MAG: phosphatase PAP2 family protein [Bacteroidota bacterium]